MRQSVNGRPRGGVGGKEYQSSQYSSPQTNTNPLSTPPTNPSLQTQKSKHSLTIRTNHVHYSDLSPWNPSGSVDIPSETVVAGAVLEQTACASQREGLLRRPRMKEVAMKRFGRIDHAGRTCPADGLHSGFSGRCTSPGGNAGRRLR